MGLQELLNEENRRLPEIGSESFALENERVGIEDESEEVEHETSRNERVAVDCGCFRQVSKRIPITGDNLARTVIKGLHRIVERVEPFLCKGGDCSETLVTRIVRARESDEVVSNRRFNCRRRRFGKETEDSGKLCLREKKYTKESTEVREKG